MIASLYQDTGDSIKRIANSVIDESKHATFIADADWEVTHFGVMETVGGPSMLSPLQEHVIVERGHSLTLDLKRAHFEFQKLEAE